jgi:hypothetical protein
VLRAFISFPTGREAEAMGSFPHATSQLHNEVMELAPRLPLSSWFDRSFQTDWLEGSLVRSFSKPATTGVLRLLEPARRSRFYPGNAIL